MVSLSIDENSKEVVIEHFREQGRQKSLFQKYFGTKKSNADLVTRISTGDIDATHIKLYRQANKSNFSEKQMEYIINSNKGTSTIETIIYILSDAKPESEKIE